MEKHTIAKEIAINAPKETVWNVLLQDRYTRLWYAVFSEGTHAETDWNEGSKVVFLDDSNSGMIGNVVVNRPSAELSVEYTGLVINGQEDYESSGAKAVQGGRETYRLSGQNGATQLTIVSDMTPEYFDMMSTAWDKALEKIKSLAEAN